MTKSKTVFITGASSGIGAATATKLAEHGHNVIITARRIKKLQKLADKIGKDKALPIAGDATSQKFLREALAQGSEQFDGIDAVFANAGTGLNTSGVADGDMDEWDKMISVNISALLYTAKLSMPYLKQTKGDFIITSSVAGRITLQGSVYGASKWFAYGFALNLAEEMAEWGGRCTTISPGMVNTAFFDEPKPDKLAPEDIAQAVLFALSAEQRCNVREICLMPTN